MNNQTTNQMAAKFALNWAYSLPSLLVTAGGGTGNVLAGELSRYLGISYDEAHTLLESVNPDWYENLFHHHGGWNAMDWESPCNVRGLGKALKRRFALGPLKFASKKELAFWAYK